MILPDTGDEEAPCIEATDMFDAMRTSTRGWHAPNQVVRSLISEKIRRSAQKGNQTCAQEPLKPEGSVRTFLAWRSGCGSHEADVCMTVHKACMRIGSFVESSHVDYPSTVREWLRSKESMLSALALNSKGLREMKTHR